MVHVIDRRDKKKKKPKRPQVIPSDEAEDREDYEMEANPSDFPFPQFAPKSGELRQKCEKSVREIHELEARKPVVVFERPEVQFNRPQWSYDSHFQHRHIPNLNLNKIKGEDMLRQPHPPSEKPTWRTSIRHVTAGCPQLGIPLLFDSPRNVAVYSPPVKQGAQTYREGAIPLRTLRSPCVTTHGTARTPRAPPPLKSSRWGTREERTKEMLMDATVVAQIRDALFEARDGTEKSSFLVALPKIGVRLFEVAPPRQSK